MSGLEYGAPLASGAELAKAARWVNAGLDILLITEAFGMLEEPVRTQSQGPVSALGPPAGSNHTLDEDARH